MHPLSYQDQEWQIESISAPVQDELVARSAESDVLEARRKVLSTQEVCGG